MYLHQINAMIGKLVSEGVVPLDRAPDVRRSLKEYWSDRIALTWTVHDVQSIREDLNHEQALDVLKHVLMYHDADVGVNWDVLNLAAESLYSKE